MAACLLAPGHGSTVFTAVAAFGAAVASADVASADVALSDAAVLTAVASQVADLDSPGEAVSPVAVVSRAGRLAEVSTAAVASMVEAAVDSTAVAEVMVAAATGN
jgi:L-fucose mutarotase/ribose pyranase (RbsD/FucU family)